MPSIQHTLMVEDLVRSGLTAKHATRLQLRPLTATATQQLKGVNCVQLPSYIIPYLDPHTGNPMSYAPEWPPFFRVRYLGEINSFDKVTGKKPQRYTQPANSGVCAYYPALTDWSTVLQNPSIKLVITEGEKKAAAACAAGQPTIGLGGLYNWRTDELDSLFIPSLRLVNWVHRKVHIIYDSDVSENPQVCTALYALAKKLERQGARPYFTKLPDLTSGNAKTGLDDYLVTGAPLSAVLDKAQSLTLAEPLWSLNRRVIYVVNPGIVVQRNDDYQMKPAAFKDHAYSNIDYVERVLLPDGTTALKDKINAAAVWLKWPLRAGASHMTYAPGQSKIVPSTGAYNIWRGWGTVPTPGSVKPFLQLVGHLFSGAPEEEKMWFLRWLAYPLQYPGAKLFTAVVMYGRCHGTGKSWLGLTMGRIYGDNFSEIGQVDLEGDFNAWAIGKQFILGDDVTGSDRRAHADQLKKLITQHSLRVRQKYVPEYTIPDCVNYYFTSNQPDAFFLEDDDRRYFVHAVEVPPLSLEFYQKYGTWLDKEDGAAHLHQYLLQLDLGNFNPTAPALRTAAKVAMTADVKGDLAEWVSRLLTDPDALLRVGEAALPGDLFTNRQLLALYDPLGQHRVTANGLGRELKRAGATQVLRGAQVHTTSGPQRYYAIRNPAKWLKAPLKEIQKHLNKPEPKELKY